MALVIGTGITVGTGISILSDIEVATDNLVLNLDAEAYLGSGSWLDTSGFDNDATLVGSPTFTSGTAGSFLFNGVDQYAEIAHSVSLKPTAAITMEQWLTAADWTAGSLPSNYLVSLSCTQGGGYSHNIWEGSWKSYVRSNGVYQIPTYDVSGFAAGSLHQFVTTFDGQFTRLYVDGVLEDTVDIGTSGNAIQYAFNNSVIIAAEAGSGTGAAGQYWPGRVAITRIYNVALTTEQVENNFTAVASRYGL